MLVSRSPHRTGQERVAILRECDLAAQSGKTSWRDAARLVAGEYNVSLATIYRWRSRQAAGSNCTRKVRSDSGTQSAKVAVEALDYLAADFARPEAPSFPSCYRRLKTLAGQEGWTIASPSTMRRRLKAYVPLSHAIRNEHAHLVPSQTRSVAHIAPMDCVNADAQRLDVRCEWEDGRISRPHLTIWQDVYSRALLGWSITKTECEDAYRTSFLRTIERYGCPGRVYVDNGRAICAISLTGGAKNRYRRTVSEHKGIITRIVGASNVRFVKPAHGQSKPIERAFRELVDTLAKHPLLAGCYTGSNPASKPTNYGSSTCDLETLLNVVRYAVSEYNTREDRTTEAGVIHDGLSAIKILESTENQRPYPHRNLVEELCFSSKRVTALSRDGTIKLFGNAYWHPSCATYVGQSKKARQVNVLYNPDDLSEVIVDIQGTHTTLTRTEQGQFDNRSDAQQAARRKRRAVKALKKAARENINLSEKELQAVWRRALQTPATPATPAAPAVIVPAIKQAA